MLRFKQFLLSESMVTTGVSTPSDGLGIGGLNQPILNHLDIILGGQEEFEDHQCNKYIREN